MGIGRFAQILQNMPVYLRGRHILVELFPDMLHSFPMQLFRHPGPLDGTQKLFLTEILCLTTGLDYPYIGHYYHYGKYGTVFEPLLTTAVDFIITE